MEMIQESESMNSVKVSVSMATFNHEKYIAKALDSVLDQDHPYSWEIIVCDDDSKDDTQNILLQYKEKYPDIIKLHFQQRNVGVAGNTIKSLEMCSGEYIAILDGDDYWTDNFKLKKQIEYLDNHRDYVLSSHRYNSFSIDQNKMSLDHEWHGLFRENENGFDVTYEIFFKYFIIHPVTAVFRRSALDLKEIRQYRKFKDLHLFFTVLKRGKAFAHNFYGAVYNIHSKGMWSKLSKYERWKETFTELDELMKRNKGHAELSVAYAVCLNHLYHLYQRKHKYPILYREGRMLMLKRMRLKNEH